LHRDHLRLGRVNLGDLVERHLRTELSTETVSSMCTFARPVRVAAISRRKSSTAFSMRVFNVA
ncbi:MAG: hypothetical protein ACLPOO_14350, partial [Terriglobales bacterium]